MADERQGGRGARDGKGGHEVCAHPFGCVTLSACRMNRSSGVAGWRFVGHEGSQGSGNAIAPCSLLCGAVKETG